VATKRFARARSRPLLALARSGCREGVEGAARHATLRIRDYLLPRSASNKNFATCIVVDFARARKRMRSAARPREPRGPAARLARALEWQRQLDVGEVASRAEIARREGVSRARVTQIMRALTKLPRRATLWA
jgi:hypothetical protein